MAGTSITANPPLHNPKAGDIVLTESGGIARVLSNTSQSGSTTPCGIRVKYLESDPPHHLTEGAYSRVFDYRHQLVLDAKVLATKQENENSLAKIWALGFYRARAYLKKVNLDAQMEVSSFDAELGTEIEPLLPSCCTNLDSDCTPRHRQMMTLIVQRQYGDIALFLMKEQRSQKCESW